MGSRHNILLFELLFPSLHDVRGVFYLNSCEHVVLFYDLMCGVECGKTSLYNVDLLSFMSLTECVRMRKTPL